LIQFCKKISYSERILARLVSFGKLLYATSLIMAEADMESDPLSDVGPQMTGEGKISIVVP
jgi:hypothetical protein